jgi:hypothetical protein
MTSSYKDIKPHELLHLADSFDRHGVKILLDQLIPVKDEMDPETLRKAESIVANNFSIAEGLRRECDRRMDQIRRLGPELGPRENH